MPRADHRSLVEWPGRNGNCLRDRHVCMTDLVPAGSGDRACRSTRLATGQPAHVRRQCLLHVSRVAADDGRLPPTRRGLVRDRAHVTLDAGEVGRRDDVHHARHEFSRAPALRSCSGREGRAAGAAPRRHDARPSERPLEPPHRRRQPCDRQSNRAIRTTSGCTSPVRRGTASRATLVRAGRRADVRRHRLLAKVRDPAALKCSPLPVRFLRVEEEALVEVSDLVEGLCRSSKTAPIVNVSRAGRRPRPTCRARPAPVTGTARRLVARSLGSRSIGAQPLPRARFPVCKGAPSKRLSLPRRGRRRD